MFGPVIALAFLASAAGRTDSADVLILRHDFESRTEVVRVQLEKGQVYRAEVSSARAVLRVRPLLSGVQGPLLLPLSGIPQADGSLSFEIRPSVAAEYEIRTVVQPRGGVTLRIYQDRSATARLARMGAKPS